MPLVLVSLGCGQDQTDTGEFQRAQEDDARAAAVRAGVGVRIVMGNASTSEQSKQIWEAIRTPKATRPVAVVAEPATSGGLTQVGRAAVAAGMGWVLVGDAADELEALRNDFPEQLAAWTAVDNEGIGLLLAQIAIRLLPGGGNVLVIEGPPHSAATLGRRKGLENGLRGSTIQIAQKLWANWKPAGAQRAADMWLRVGGSKAIKPDLVISQNDEMVTGFVRAVQASKPDWTEISAIGCDGLAGGGKAMVRNRVLAATIVTPPATGPGVDLVVRSLQGERVPLRSHIPVQAYPPLAELRARSR